MFGYVCPLNSELKVKDFETYKSIYCGLCHEMSSSLGFFSRFFLSYDFTFLALLDIAINEEDPIYIKKGCFINPFIKRKCCKKNHGIEIASTLAGSMIYYKVKDNISDSRFLHKLKYYLILPIVKHAYNLSRKKNKQISSIVTDYYNSQITIEKSEGPIDMYAEPSGVALGRSFELISDINDEKRVLYRIGYLIGRWIYIMDAVEDFEDDFKEKQFNPFLKECKNKAECINAALPMLNITLGEMIAARNLLEFKRYNDIIDNIFYLGLANIQEQKLKQINKGDNK